MCGPTQLGAALLEESSCQVEKLMSRLKDTLGLKAFRRHNRNAAEVDAVGGLSSLGIAVIRSKDGDIGRHETQTSGSHFVCSCIRRSGKRLSPFCSGKSARMSLVCSEQKNYWTLDLCCKRGHLNSCTWDSELNS